MRLAVINTKTKLHSVFEGRKHIQSNVFTEILTREELRDYMKDPAAFVDAVGYADDDIQA